ncbi:uncharacterized protein [Rutidosis leptorrhynchoides]|uniref:uncharacterized protein n=1 Tax=Rutidosis leptorrhynchoides TaxID=125765 RepID=UPI003A99D2F6
MNPPSEETIEDGNQRKKSVRSVNGGSSVSGAKTRRYSMGAVTTSRKSLADEGNVIPNYLRASTGSCHDFCKYGHKHENSKSKIPIVFKRTKVIHKDKVVKTVVPVETKKTTTSVKVKPSTDPKIRTPAEPILVNKKDISVPVKKAQVLKLNASTNGKETRSEPKTLQRSTSLVRPSRVTASSDGSKGFNGGIKKKDITTVKKMLSTPKTIAIKKVPTELQPLKPVFGKAASSTALKHKNSKQESPLKDQNRLQKANNKRSIADKVRTKNLLDVESESEIKPETVEFDFAHPDIDLSNPDIDLSKSDNGFIHSASESFSGKDVVEQEFTEAESEIQPESLEFDSSHFGVDFNNSTSDSLLGKTLPEEECGDVDYEVKPESEAFDLTHQDVDFIHSTSESYSGKNGEEFFEAESKVKHEMMEFDFVHPASESFSGKSVAEEELTIIDPVNESIFMNEELVEKPSIAPIVVESSNSCSDKDLIEDDELIAPAVSESSESFYDEEVILEDDYEYTDDDEEEEVEVSEEEFESETANDGKKETSVENQNKIPRKGRVIMPEDKDDEAVKLRFRRGRILDVKSENNGPRRLKFRKGRITEDKNVNQHVARRSFEKNYVEEKGDLSVASESVVLKHQGEQGKKDAQGLFNNVIEETASKLVETRKSKVKALVGAFETVISLQDGKP